MSKFLSFSNKIKLKNAINILENCIKMLYNVKKILPKNKKSSFILFSFSMFIVSDLKSVFSVYILEIHDLELCFNNKIKNLCIHVFGFFCFIFKRNIIMLYFQVVTTVFIHQVENNSPRYI